MKTVSHALMFPAVCVAVMAPLAVAASWCMALYGYDPSGVAWLSEQESRGAVLDRRVRACFARYEGKRIIVKELIGGRLTLTEAAAGFRQVEEATADAEGGGSCGSEEAAWANVILWVKGILDGDPSRRAAVVPALEAKFLSRFGHTYSVP